jgi:hypothetical protein
MGVVSTTLDERAREIFTDLGYEVTPDDGEYRAERKWRTVYVTTADPAEAPGRGRLRCFVADDDRATAVRNALLAMGPDYDWAVVGVDDDGYTVHHPDATVLSPP